MVVNRLPVVLLACWFAFPLMAGGEKVYQPLPDAKGRVTEDPDRLPANYLPMFHAARKAGKPLVVFVDLTGHEEPNDLGGYPFVCNVKEFPDGRSDTVLDHGIVVLVPISSDPDNWQGMLATYWAASISDDDIWNAMEKKK